MPRHDRSHGFYHTRKQKGPRHSKRGAQGTGSYSRLGKRRVADQYNRPYVEGSYRKDVIL